MLIIIFSFSYEYLAPNIVFTEPTQPFRTSVETFIYSWCSLLPKPKRQHNEFVNNLFDTATTLRIFSTSYSQRVIIFFTALTTAFGKTKHPVPLMSLLLDMQLALSVSVQNLHTFLHDLKRLYSLYVTSYLVRRDNFEHMLTHTVWVIHSPLTCQ